MNIAQPFLERLESLGDAVSVTSPRGRVAGGALLHRAIQAQYRQLVTAGFAPGDRAVIQVPNGPHFVVATVAVLAAGGVPVLCEPSLGEAAYRSCLDAAAPRWVLVHPLLGWLDRAPWLRRALRRREIYVPPVYAGPEVKRLRVSDREVWGAVDGPEAVSPVLRAAEDDAVIVFTGGTTDAPKGVRLSHAALEHYLALIGTIVEDLPIQRYLADTPQQVLYALYHGRSALVSRGRTRRRAQFLRQCIEDKKIDAYFGSPFVWMELMREFAPAEKLSEELRVVLLGGAPVTQAFLQQLQGVLHPSTQVWCLYGATETGPVSRATAAEKIAWAGGGDYVGAALPGLEVSLQDVNAEGIGELVVRSPAAFTGYLGQPEAAGQYHSGDLARLVEHAGGPAVVLAGRKKDMIIRAGVNIYPGLVEPVLLALRDRRGAACFADCALVGVWDAQRQDERVVLCYTAGPGLPSAKKELRRAVETATGPGAAPDAYLQLPELPVTGRQNKLDKPALRQMAQSRFLELI